MTQNIERWIISKQKEGYKAEYIQKALVMNGMEPGKAAETIKRVSLDDMERDTKKAKSKNKEEKIYIDRRKRNIIILTTAIIIMLASAMTIIDGNYRCNALAIGDRGAFCKAIDSISDTPEAIQRCESIEDTRLSAACIDSVLERTETTDKTLCDMERDDPRNSCLAAMDRKWSTENYKLYMDQHCKKIEDDDLKTWCISKSYQSRDLREAIMTCRDIENDDYRTLCKADAYNFLGEEKDITCQKIEDKKYRFVCMNLA